MPFPDKLLRTTLILLLFSALAYGGSEAVTLKDAFASSEGGGAGAPIAVGLRVKNNTSNPNHQIDIDADYVVMRDGGSPTSLKTFSAIDETADITSDLDTGSEAMSTWYYFYLVSTDGSTVTCKVSTNASNPTGLNLTDYRLRVASCYNDGSYNFRQFLKAAKVTYYVGDWISVAYGSSGGSITVPTWTAVSCASVVPPTCSRISGILVGAATSSSASWVTLTCDNTKNASTKITLSNITATTIGSPGYAEKGTTSWFDEIPISSQTVYWGLSTYQTAYIRISGYSEEVY